MKQCVLLVFGLALCASGAPVEQGAGMETGSCQDAQALGAAGLALTEINKDRQEGYILSLYRMANVNMMKHGETGVVFYLTLDVVETNCHVLSRKDWKKCEARSSSQTPVYGQCKATIFISKVHRVVRLYKYDCTIRPVPSEKVVELCPDCPTRIAKDSEIILSTASKSLDKYNKESGLANRFAMRNVTLATASMGGMAMFYNVEYTVQETTCANGAETKTEDCPIMDCEFAHKGHCKGSFSRHPGGEDISVECEIYEPEAAEKEKKHHLLGEKTDHSHSDAHTEGGVDQTHDAAHDATQGSHPHDHVHDHTKSHKQHDATQVHAADSEHHHTHDHEGGMTHSHAHSHDHGHGHDHVHAHHAKAHDHSGDLPNQHHKYHDASAPHTHEHDHEIALDHDHKHAHLHDHEHHHHHHEHTHEPHRHPEGEVRVLPALGQPVTLPSFPDQPVGGPEEGVTLPLIPDPDIPGQREPTILPFPTAVASDCPALVPTQAGVDLAAKMFAEDPMFKAAA